MAAASALEGKLGLQLIQTVQVPSGSDFAEASISVDWDQWAEIHLLFQPKLTGTTTYSIYFYDTVNKHSASLAENQSGIWGAVLYPMFDKTRSMTGHTGRAAPSRPRRCIKTWGSCVPAWQGAADRPAQP